VGATPRPATSTAEAQERHAFLDTDPDARLFRKGAGKEAKLCHMGHLMMENAMAHRRCAVDEANGTAERSTALAHDRGQCQARQHRGRRQELRHRRLCSPAAANAAVRRMSRRTMPTAAPRSTRPRPAIRLSHQHDQAQADRRTLWLDEDRRGLRKTRHRWARLVEWFFVLTAVAYNLVRVPKLLAATDESVWSVEYEAKPQPTPPMQRGSRPSLRFFDPQTPRKSLQNQVFQQPARRHHSAGAPALLTPLAASR